MATLSLLFQGFHTALLPVNLLAAFTGAILGLIVGAMPGLGSLSGVALLLPLTFKMNPTTAIIMLAALYYANMFGGSYSAILLNIPGDSPAVMTCLDGYPMAQKGRPGQALFTANFSSFLGGTIGIILLTIFGPLLAEVGLAFGPAEMTMVILLALTSIGWLLGENPIKGLIATSVGILMATIGLDIALGTPRFTFGSVNLMNGLSFVPVVIGMFGFSQVIEMMASKEKPLQFKETLTLKKSLLKWHEIKTTIPVILRSSILGNFVGVLPGAGATTGAFFAYILEKRIGKNKKQMGSGAIQGVAAAESANNAAAVGAFAPLLSLGIPGSGTTAVLLGGLMMWGLRPGPLLFTEQPEFTWGLIASMYTGNIMCILVGLLIIPILMHIIKIPQSVLAPFVTLICIVGSYSTNNSMFDVGTMLAAGVLAFYFKMGGYPIAPLLLAFVLSPRLEQAARQAFEISNGSALIFLQKPISLFLFLSTIILIIAPVIMKRRRKHKNH